MEVPVELSWHDADPRAKREFIRGLIGLAAFIGLLLLGALVVWVLAQQGGHADFR